MKKIYLALILAFMFIFNTSVYAEEGYTPGKNSYINSAMSEGAKIVVVYKGEEKSDITSENIYYINQSDDAEGFSNLEMLMRLDAPAGVYTVLTDIGTTTFEISDAQAAVSGAAEIDFIGAKLNGDGTYSAAFGFNAEVLLSDVSALTMVNGDKAYTTAMFGENSIINWGSGYIYNEGENTMFAIQIDGIGAEYFTNENETLVPNFDLYVK